MAKAHSPVRLEASLMEDAALSGEVFKRSAAEQVEFWAFIGRLVAPRITPDDLLELQAGLAEIKVEKSPNVVIDSDSLQAELDQARDSGALQSAIAGNQIRYQASLAKPGFLEQVAPDGSVIVGQFQDGQFKAIA